MKEVDKAYLAGIIDGEGTIGLYRVNTAHRGYGALYNYHLRVTVVNTNTDLITYLSQLTPYKTATGVSNRRAINHLFYVRWHGKYARDLLSDLLPYLRIKRKQAILLIETFDKAAELQGGNWRSRQATENRYEIVELREKAKHIMTLLNTKGYGILAG